MAPYLFLNPIPDERETPTRVTYRKVIHKPAKDRIDLFDQSTDGLGLTASENHSKLRQEGRPFLEFRYPHFDISVTKNGAKRSTASLDCPLMLARNLAF
jgi:hypothetical protein